MKVYDGAFTVEHKEDDSPLTLADLESQRIIVESLRRLTPDIPVLSEESAQAPWSERQSWRELWVVDPLDGTREFVKRNGEFTVNIALVREHEPVLGIVAAPAKGTSFWGALGLGAYRRDEGGRTREIRVSAPGCAAPGGRKPIAHEPRDRGLSGRFSAARNDRRRQLAEILLGGGGQGGALSPLRTRPRNGTRRPDRRCWRLPADTLPGWTDIGCGTTAGKAWSTATSSPSAIRAC